MRKKWMIGALATAVITGSIIGANTMGVGLAKEKEEQPEVTKQQSSVVANVHAASDQVSKQELLTIDEVVAIALKHVDGRVDSVELERDNGRRYYEIEIENSTTEYELDIDAYTGVVLKIEEDKRDRDRDDRRQNKQVQQAETTHVTESVSKPASKPATTQKTPVKTNDNASRNNKTMLTMSEAIAIAKAKAPGKVDEAELERDDGQVYYEIEIDTARGEVEIEVDAYTGQILSIEYDD